MFFTFFDNMVFLQILTHYNPPPEQVNIGVNPSSGHKNRRDITRVIDVLFRAGETLVYEFRTARHTRATPI